MLLPFFEWLDTLAIGDWISESAYAAPYINVGHLLALVVVIGSVLVVDLRLLGHGMSNQPLAKVARNALPWLRRTNLDAADRDPTGAVTPNPAVLQPLLLDEDARSHDHAHFYIHAPP